MELLPTIDAALDLTRLLHEALENQDLDACGDLLDQRGQAMSDFENAHRSASDQERVNCRLEMAELHGSDECLRGRSKEIMAMVTTEFRKQLGLPANGLQQVSGDPLQACLDRKA